MKKALSTFWIADQSPKMHKVMARVKRLAQVPTPVLIVGAPGSGRSSLAQVLHGHSVLAKQPAVFLHAQTSNTCLHALYEAMSAHRRQPNDEQSRLELEKIVGKDGNTVVIENIERLSSADQACLEAICDYQELLVTKTPATNYVGFKVVCTASVNLLDCCKQGKFSDSLYYRFNPVKIELPKLSERMEDFDHICKFMLRVIGKRYNLKDSDVAITDEALDLLRKWKWHGNLRELSSTLEQALLNNNQTGAIRNTDIGVEARVLGSSLLTTTTDQDTAYGQSKVTNLQTKHSTDESVSLEDYFQNFVLQHQDSLSETELARKLGISRKCLWERRQRFGIPRIGASGQER